MLFKWNKVKYILTTARQYATRSKRWTPEESKKLVAMVKKHGRQWNKLHPMFPDRTITALMSRYSLLLSGIVKTLKKFLLLTLFYCSSKR